MPANLKMQTNALYGVSRLRSHKGFGWLVCMLQMPLFVPAGAGLSCYKATNSAAT